MQVHEADAIWILVSVACLRSGFFIPPAKVEHVGEAIVIVAAPAKEVKANRHGGRGRKQPGSRQAVERVEAAGRSKTRA